MRRSFAALAPFSLLFLAACGATPEAPPGDRVHPDMASLPVTFAAIADARIAPGAPTRTAELVEAIGDLSATPGLDFAVLVGNMIENADAAALEPAVSELSSTLGILAAPKVYALGARERRGVAPGEAVVRALADATLLPARTGTYSLTPRAGVRVIALDPEAPDAAEALGRALGEAKEGVAIVASAAPPPAGPLRDLLAKDAHVKALLVPSPAPTDLAAALRGMAVVAVPSLAEVHGYVLLEVSGETLTVYERAPGARAPTKESKHVLRPAPAARAGQAHAPR